LRRLFVSALLGAFLAAEAHAGGTIHGQIWPSRTAARGAQPERRSMLDVLLGRREPQRRPPPRRDPDVADAVVMVREIPEGAERRLARDAGLVRPRLAFRGSRLVPRVTAVPAGSALEIENRDGLWHGAFSLSPTTHFDLANLAPGTVRAVGFPRAGVVNVHCELHPDEIGYVVVAPNHAFARADSLGRFELPKLPPGEYEVSLWHPRRGSRVTRMVVPKRGESRCELAF